MEGIIGMIKLFAVDNPPPNWKSCNGEMLAVSDYPELFAITQYRFGGEDKEFALPALEKDAAGFFVIRVTASPEEVASFKGMVSQVVLWVGDVVPAGWVPCDGRWLDPNEYPVLGKVMGGRFGLDQQGRIAMPAFQPLHGVNYIICVEGLDPMAAEEDDDDY